MTEIPQDRALNEEQDRAERLKVVALGIEAERFLTSPLGRYFITRAEHQREEALANLIGADPHKADLVQRLQNEVRLVDMVQQWIADAITEGQAQEKALIDEQLEGGGS